MENIFDRSVDLGEFVPQPDDDMIEVAIAAVEAVFDWKKYLEENFPEQYPAGYFEKEDQTGKNVQEITEWDFVRDRLVQS